MAETDKYLKADASARAEAYAAMKEHIRTRLAAASAAPWVAAPIASEKSWAKVYTHDLKQCIADTNGPNAEPDAVFMAHARTDVEWLLRQLDEKDGVVS